MAKLKSKPAVNITEGNQKATIQKLSDLVAAIRISWTGFFDEGVKKEGAQCRGRCQEVRKLCQEMRFMVQAKKNADKA